MIIQRVNRTNPEKVFIITYNDETTAMVKGTVVDFDYDGTDDGLSIVDSSTGDAAKSHLAAGIVDTALAAQAYGLVQCYGVRTDAVILHSGTASNANAAIGDALIMDTTNDGLSGCAAGAISEYFPGFVMGETMASSSGTVTTTGTIFIRMM
jgi:hypothetical protein